MRPDPAPGHQFLGDLGPAGHAGADVAAEVPRVLDAVEGVQEEGEGQRGGGDEVRGDVGDESGVGDAVGGVDDRKGFRAERGCGWKGVRLGRGGCREGGGIGREGGDGKGGGD